MNSNAGITDILLSHPASSPALLPSLIVLKTRGALTTATVLRRKDWIRLWMGLISKAIFCSSGISSRRGGQSRHLSVSGRPKMIYLNSQSRFLNTLFTLLEK